MKSYPNLPVRGWGVLNPKMKMINFMSKDSDIIKEKEEEINLEIRKKVFEWLDTRYLTDEGFIRLWNKGIKGDLQVFFHEIEEINNTIVFNFESDYTLFYDWFENKISHSTLHPLPIGNSIDTNVLVYERELYTSMSDITHLRMVE